MPDQKKKTEHQEERLFRPAAHIRLEANISGQEIDQARTWFKQDPQAFWEQAAKELDWFSPWHDVRGEGPNPGWFVGGRCNIVHNCLDRHVHSANRNKLALLWESESGESRKWTYFELSREVNRLAGGLRRLGFGPGSVFVLCLPPIPEAVAASLAIAKIGAVQSHVFVGFSAKVLRSRIAALQADCVICADGFSRNGRIVELKKYVDTALDSTACDSVELDIVIPRLGLDHPLRPDRDLRYEDVLQEHHCQEPTEELDSEHILFVQYTSGTTGEPKGVVHCHGGYMVALHRSMQWVLDNKPTDIVWCLADLGWITGLSYSLWGPLLAGSTTLLYEGHPLFPKADRLWRIVDSAGVSVLYATPTLMRMVRRYGQHFPQQHDLNTLRLLASVGEPLAPDVWLWWHKHIGQGQCPLLNTWWQTETGSIVLSSLPAKAIKVGSVGRALPGIEAAVVDEAGNPLPSNQTGHLVLHGSWPAFFRGLFRDSQDCFAKYWSKDKEVYWTGDLARQDQDGCLWVLGRRDEVLNIAGHIIAASEVENALMVHPEVHEAAVVAIPDKIRGQAAKAYVVLKPDCPGSEELSEELSKVAREELGSIVRLKEIVFTEHLPKTESGKILHRSLRKKTDITKDQT